MACCRVAALEADCYQKQQDLAQMRQQLETVQVTQAYLLLGSMF